MKRYIKSMSKLQSTGVFWYIDDMVIAFPYDPTQYTSSLSKTGMTYTHKALWPEIAGKYRKYSYNYFPRGRVDIDNKGRSVIYMNPNIPQSAIQYIKIEFGIVGTPIVKYDNSSHYLCHLDDGWKPER